MRILFFVRSIDSSRGGVERNTNTLYRYFESQGIECFCIYAETPVVDSRDIPSERRMQINLKAGRKQLVGQCMDYIKNNNIDIILNRGIYFSFLFKLYGKLKKEGRCRIYHSFHSSPDDLSPRRKTFWMRLKRLYHNLPILHNRQYKRRNMYRVCDRFILLSSSYVESAYRELRLPDREKLMVIANPRPYHDINPEQIAAKKKQVLIVSRLDNVQKNLKAAVRIWRKMERRGTDGWELVLAGHGDDEKNLLKYIGRQGFSNFRFVGRSDNPLTLYQESSIFMMTSHYEGFPTTLQESLQNACVPIVFDTFTALHDIITDGYDGLAVSPYDEDAFADAMYQLMHDDDRRMRMGMAGMNTCDKFRIEIIGQQWLDLFVEG